MRLNITTHTKTEHKALMALLYSLGYTYHEVETYQEAHAIYHGYDNTVVKDNMRLAGNTGPNIYYTDREYIFSKDLSEFLQALFKTKPINVGDYKAEVNRDTLYINGADISFETISGLRDKILSRKSVKKRDFRMNITINSSIERKALIYVLSSLGYLNRYNDTVEKWIAAWDEKDYRSVLIYSDSMYVGANDTYSPNSYDEKEYHFSKDLAEIEAYATDTQNKSVEPDEPIGYIAGYNSRITSTDVVVGCQVIPHAKVIEIYDTMVSLR
jgi:hypothetical protein